jgi:hypothetical protein
MDWEIELIRLYYWVSDAFEGGGHLYAQRFNKNHSSTGLDFLDEEALTVYYYGIRCKYRTVKDIHMYAQKHLLDWFPNLPSYAKFNERLNFLNPVMAYTAQLALKEDRVPKWLRAVSAGAGFLDAVLDSMPVILAKGGRSDSAKVAREVADKGYCSTKKLWYHGVKLHQLGICVPAQMPDPQCLMLSAASEHDNTVFKEQIAPKFRGLRVFLDKAYHDGAAAPMLLEKFEILTEPVHKRKKNQKELHYDQKLRNTEVSRVRQPCESFFNWIIEKTGIQVASKVRSLKGLMKHVFGKLTAALLILNGI